MDNILIQECKVFVNIEGEMKETTDYSLIGAAVLQASEDKQLKVSM
ncbi:hypothetical protein [Tenacibaculum litopenaei]